MIDTRAFLLETLGLHTRPTEARGRIIVAEAETETTEESKWAEGEVSETATDSEEQAALKF